MSSETRKNITEEQRLRRNENSRKSKQKKRDAEKSIVSARVVIESSAKAEETPCLLNPHTAEIDRQIEEKEAEISNNNNI